MPLFKYEAVDGTGRKLRAVLESPDETTLVAEIRKTGLIPISIAAAGSSPLLTFRRTRRKDIPDFTQELGSLLEAGLQLDKALFVLSEHSGNSSFKSIIKQVYTDIQKGNSFSQALSKHKAFPELYVNMVKAGESGGILEIVIKRLASFLETTVAFAEEITSALIYPALLTVVSGISVLILLLYVVPQFATIFAEAGQALPLPTTILLNVSHAFLAHWLLLATGIVAAFFIMRALATTRGGRIFIDNLKLRIPLVKTLHMKMIVARFTRTFGTLLQSGVPILEALKVSRGVLGNDIISADLLRLEEMVKKGKGVSIALRESMFPPVVTQMMAVGEESGKLDETLLMMADRFEAESRRLIKRLLSLLEPTLILCMGLIVGFIVVSMLLAIFSINDIPI